MVLQTMLQQNPEYIPYAIAALPIGILLIWMGLNYIWNRRIRPAKVAAGRATASFNNILGRALRLNYIDDGQPNAKIKNPNIAKHLSSKKITWMLTILTPVSFIVNPILGILTLTYLIAHVYTRSAKVFAARHQQLIRMLQVASANLKYDKNAETNPWQFVNITKWDNLVEPKAIELFIPPNFNTHDQRSRENFERHFGSAVTDKNSWSYEWKASEGQVICTSVDHIPTMAPYPGSGHVKWNEIPIGIGRDGEVIWDVKVAPHALILGTTGAGKSTIQRNIIFHCIQHPNNWIFMGIDVKRVELTAYKSYDDIVAAIAVDVEAGLEVIRFANDEMMKRYTDMEENGVNNFADLAAPPKALMVMIDESYMFLATSGIKTDEGKEIDQMKGEASKLIGDIARLGRASGVHLVMATQRPDATVIYGELKQNLSCRMSAGRADSIASQMALDNDEATRLPAIKGRGYFQINGAGEEFQGYYADQNWIDEWLQKQQSGVMDSEMNLMEPEMLDEEPKKSPFKFKKKSSDSNNDEKSVKEPKEKKSFLGKLQAFNESHSTDEEEAQTQDVHSMLEQKLQEESNHQDGSELNDIFSQIKNEDKNLKLVETEISENDYDLPKLPTMNMSTKETIKEANNQELPMLSPFSVELSDDDFDESFGSGNINSNQQGNVIDGLDFDKMNEQLNGDFNK